VRREPRWVSKAAVLAIHERLVAEHGGAPDLLDEGKLDAALASPRNHFAYEERDLFRLASAYAQALTRDHPFQDGNKRVALTVAGVFLERNGYLLGASEQDAVKAILALVTRELEEEGFAAWLRAASSRASRPKGIGAARKRAGSRAARPRKE
jgi:death-on-curing protein